jgi:predicted nucleotidyltransferase
MVMESPPIEKIVSTIVERFNPKRIILFGSRARGDADPESDVDLFIEMETAKSPPDRAIDVISLFGLRRWSMDVFVYTPEEVERRRNVNGTLVSIVESEGKLLYERP